MKTVEDIDQEIRKELVMREIPIILALSAGIIFLIFLATQVMDYYIIPANIDPFWLTVGVLIFIGVCAAWINIGRMVLKYFENR